MELLKSPLNYTGNKYRILNQIIPLMPEKKRVVVDLFCGGATVGLNIECEEIFFVDSNIRIINLLKFLSLQEFDSFIKQLEKYINKFNLSYSFKNGYAFYRTKCTNKTDNNGLKDYNSKGFYELRDYYNSLKDKNSDEANILLYLLMVYGFNNDIRFNNEGAFNLPVGKTDLNKMNVNKIKAYIDRCKQINAHFVCASFGDKIVSELVDKSDFIYMDPPYLITNAVYNVGWSEVKEKELLDFISKLIDKQKNFALSNVLRKEGATNSLLLNWCEKYNSQVKIHDINYHYRSSSYNKKNRHANEREVLITNRRYYEKN